MKKTGIKEADFENWFKETFIKYEGNTLNFEAHHIIPVDILKTNKDLKELLFWAEKEGKSFNFNAIENGIMLQKKSLNLDIAGHASHKKYSEAIGKKITLIISNPSNVGKPQKAFDEIQQLIKKTKDKLEKEVLLGNKNVNEIINF